MLLGKKSKKEKKIKDERFVCEKERFGGENFGFFLLLRRKNLCEKNLKFRMVRVMIRLMENILEN